MHHESTPGEAGKIFGADGSAADRSPRDRSRRRFLEGTMATAAAGMVLSAPRDAEAATATLPQLYPGQNRAIFQQILNDENTHTNFLIGLMGALSRPKPIFRNLVAVNVRQFAGRASTFEVIAARAYTAAEPYINDPSNLSAAIRVGMVEARHSSFVYALLNQPLVPGRFSFEPPMGQSEVVANITPYVSSLNGGPPPAYDLARSDANDVNILNFLLLLEYLQAEFYNVNVFRFF